MVRPMPIEGYLKDHIDKQGPISFSMLMQNALYHPDWGYYEQTPPPIGRSGDFTTAPEISERFGVCLARQITEILEQIGGGSVLEIGPGSGKLAHDILMELHARKALPKSYHLFDVSDALARHQANYLRLTLPPEAFACIKFEKSLPTNKPFKGVIIANEVMDAIPVETIVKQSGTWRRRMVSYEKDTFHWHVEDESAKPSEATELASSWCLRLPDDYQTEIQTNYKACLTPLYESLTEGIMLIIDYGFTQKEYYHPDRHMGTVIGHTRHKVQLNPLVHIGQQDLTAHVNFCHLTNEALRLGFDLAGFTTQAFFLLNLGIIDGNLKGLPSESAHANNQIKQLIWPTEMGELFKVLALSKNHDKKLQGFDMYDLRHKMNIHDPKYWEKNKKQKPKIISTSDL
jgi:SAM-dependent MidA family methyltransferase